MWLDTTALELGNDMNPVKLNLVLMITIPTNYDCQKNVQMFGLRIKVFTATKNCCCSKKFLLVAQFDSKVHLGQGIRV